MDDNEETANEAQVKLEHDSNTLIARLPELAHFINAA
jgi:hypothetical protein